MHQSEWAKAAHANPVVAGVSCMYDSSLPEERAFVVTLYLHDGGKVKGEGASRSSAANHALTRVKAREDAA